MYNVCLILRCFDAIFFGDLMIEYCEIEVSIVLQTVIIFKHNVIVFQIVQEIGNIIIVENAHVLPISSGKRKRLFSNVTRELSCEIHHYRFEVIVNNKPLF